MTRPEAFYLPSGSGQRYCLFHAPQGLLRGLVLYVHPFAEELNKTRRMAALQARALAQAGYGVLQIDLLGCGDSSGDFADARWDAWVADLVQASQWLDRHDTGRRVPRWLWGLRGGCLLAADAARAIATPWHVLFWQPSFASGALLLQQFLRLKLAADLLARADTGSKGAMDALRQRLAAGEPLEIAGYRLAPELAHALDRARLDPPVPASGPPQRLCIVEVSTLPAAEPSPVALRTQAAWQQAGWDTRALAVPGPAFWQSSDIEEAPQLLQATLRLLRDEVPASAAPSLDATRAGTRGDVSAPMLTLAPVPAGPAERAVSFPCAGETLHGVLATPASRPPHATGVVIVVGGPQYRIGSHRQFVWLARSLAAAGHAVLRFDVRGMGDSTGAARPFEDLQDDIAAAIEALQQAEPAVRQVALWGLCDGASACLLYLDATQDARVAGVCLVNPWVRSEQSLARTHVKHYYRERLLQKAFWAKLVRGGVGLQALRDIAANVRRLVRPAGSAQLRPFQQRMASAWNAFGGALLVLLSGDDWTAREFDEHLQHSPDWRHARQHARLRWQRIEDADHTLSIPAAREQAERLTLAWLQDLPPR